MIESAASTASLGIAGERPEDCSASRRPGAARSPADAGEAALGDELILATFARFLGGSFFIVIIEGLPDPED